MQRMADSAFAFLRGSAPLFYEILKLSPELAKGPDGEGWITGDLHPENFGAFRTEGKGSSSFPVVFDLNDFDDAVVGPWRLDVLRLLTSLLLWARGFPGAGSLSLQGCESMLDGYLGALHRGKEIRKPLAVQKLLSKVKGRTPRQFLDDRTVQVRRARRFVRGERYQELSKRLQEHAGQAFSHYVEMLPEKWRGIPRAFEVEDAAFRIAGTGSLGLLRIGIVARGKGPPHGQWLFDMKEQQSSPSPAILLRDPGVDGARRVETAFRQCLIHPPRMIGRTQLGKTSMFVRRLAPQEDKLNVTSLKREELVDVARYLGSLAGAGHRRGATRAPVRWSKQSQQKLVDQATVLAAIHEATYLAYCRLMSR